MHFISSIPSFFFSHSNSISESKPSRCCSSELAKKIGAIFCSFLFITSGVAQAAQRLRKVAQVGPFYPHEVRCGINQEPASNVMGPYVSNAGALAQPSIAPGSKFPAGWEAFWLNEAILGKRGDCGCLQLLDAKRCELLCDAAKQEIDRGGHHDAVYTDKVFRYKGFKVGIGLDDDTMYNVLLGLNPKIKENYGNAIDKVEADFINDPCFFKKSIGDILLFIKDLHKLLLDGIGATEAANDSELRPGQLRLQPVAVSRDDAVERDPQSLRAKLATLGVQEAGLKLFDRSLKKLQRVKDMSAFFDACTQEELALWKKLFYLPPKPAELKERMRTFVVTLKQMAKECVHPVALAAWAHCELGRIHPFADGNGRLARLLMNAILIRGGYSPVQIPNDRAYSSAIDQDELEPGAFARYLASLL